MLPVWYPEDRDEKTDFKAKGEVALKHYTYQGKSEIHQVFVVPEDDLNLFVKWIGKKSVTVSTIIKWNPGIKNTGLVPGEAVYLHLTPLEETSFSSERAIYLTHVRAHKGHQTVIQKKIDHIVKANETIKDILDQYDTDLTLLEKFNSRPRLTNLHEGEVVVVPIVAKSRQKSERLPGPPAPAPAPIPEPPKQRKPVVAAPEKPVEAGKVVKQASTVVKPVAKAKDPKTAVTVKKAKSQKEYIVQPGDSGWVIATKRLGIDIKKLQSVNPGVDISKLQPGQRLVVP